MDIKHPISSVIPSVEGVVLEALAGTNAPLNLVSVQAIASDASLSGVRKALLRLVRTGLVRQVPGGYVLNREHIAAPAVMMLASLRTELLHRLSETISEWSPQPLLAGLFGSSARRDGTDESDIDILVITDAPADSEQAGALAAQVENWTGNHCHVVTITMTDLKRMRRLKEPILTEWQRDLVLVVGDMSVFRRATA